MSVILAAGAEQLTQFIERIERLEEEKRVLMADIKDVYAGKSHRLEPKIMRQVVRLLHECDLLSEQDALLDTYRNALTGLGASVRRSQRLHDCRIA